MDKMTKEEACRIISENKLQISQLIDDCEKVADASGVSFQLSIASVRNSYVPKSAVQAEETDDSEGGFEDERGCRVYTSYGESPYPGGWQESMC